MKYILSTISAIALLIPIADDSYGINYSFPTNIDAACSNLTYGKCDAYGINCTSATNFAAACSNNVFDNCDASRNCGSSDAILNNCGGLDAIVS